VAPTYGNAELRLGKWIKEYHGNLFLAWKTGKRTKREAAVDFSARSSLISHVNTLLIKNMMIAIGHKRPRI